MKKPFLALTVGLCLFSVSKAAAQDLEPNVHEIRDGIYVYVGGPRPNDAGPESNCGIILTRDGVVLIDSGQTPLASRAIQNAVKKLTSQPVRYIIHTETHADHWAGDYLFSPPAVVIAHEGTTVALKDREPGDPERIERMRASSPEMRAALEGYHFALPQIEYRQKMTLSVGERTFELLYLKNAHSEADTAIWLPNEGALFSASVVVVNQFNIMRPWVDIPDVLADVKMLKELNPEFVIPGHGTPGTIRIFDDMERYYALLMDRVGTMVRQGKSLDQIQKELKMPEYDNWMSKDRIPGNVEAAYNAVVGRMVYRDGCSCSVTQ